ncbi:hypothetical protein ACOHYD_09660 [Desulfobacterota bacterium M19]
MKKQKRVTERYECLMPASLLLKSAVDGRTLAGPEEGLLYNISPGGAALLVDRLEFGRYHLMESPLEDENKVLELATNEVEIICRPVWFHASGGQEGLRFCFGVAFLQPAGSDEMRDIIQKVEPEASGGWKDIWRRWFAG